MAVVSITEASRMTGVSITAIRYQFQKGKLPLSRFNDEAKVYEIDLDEALKFFGNRTSSHLKDRVKIASQTIENKDNKIDILEALLAKADEREVKFQNLLTDQTSKMDALAKEKNDEILKLLTEKKMLELEAAAMAQKLAEEGRKAKEATEQARAAQNRLAVKERSLQAVLNRGWLDRLFNRLPKKAVSGQEPAQKP